MMNLNEKILTDENNKLNFDFSAQEYVWEIHWLWLINRLHPKLFIVLTLAHSNITRFCVDWDEKK